MLKTSSLTRGDIFYFKLDGYVDLVTGNVIDKLIRESINRENYQIIIDMSDLEYMSSAGWGILVGEIKEVRENGGDIKLVNMQANVEEVFDLLEFSFILRHFRSLSDAVADFDRPYVVKSIDDRYSRASF